MAESTNNKLMTEAEFNAAVRKWTNSIRSEMVESASNEFAKGKAGTFSSIKDQMTHQKLKESITRNVRTVYGVANSVGFGFAKQGIYLHYGVGRGYVRSGGSVVRASNIRKKLKRSHATGNMERRAVNRHININSSKKYTLKLLLKKQTYDTRKIFNLRNLNFICKQIQYEITINGISPIVEGEFYRLGDEN
jgi:hypothetical protein